jgi:flagellar biosynthetic protein FliR
LGEGFVTALVNILTQSFVLGISAGAPVLVALLLTTLFLGLISRTLPQINTMTVGLSLNAMVAIGATCVSIGIVAWTFPEHAERVLGELQEVIQQQL